MRALEKTKLRIGFGLIAIPVLVVACAAIAQGQSSASAPPPPDVIQNLEKALVGKWSTTYEFAEGSSRTLGTGAGEEDWRTGPGAYVLIEEEHCCSDFPWRRPGVL